MSTAIKSVLQIGDGMKYVTHHPETEVDQVVGLSDELEKLSQAIKTGTSADSVRDLLLESIIPKTAPAHNAFYRGKDLTEYYFNGGLSTAIQAGTFDDIFPGDYFTKSVTIDGTTYENVKWIIGDLDYHLHRGDTETTEHHVVLFPEDNIGTAQMNSTNTTTGGYQGSAMWKTTIPKYVTGIVNAFGSDHVLQHRERLTNAMNADFYSAVGAGFKGSTYWLDGEWVDVKVNIFNQAMMYGHAPFASSGYDTLDCNKQIAAFHYGQNFTRKSLCWLRDVASATYFAYAGSNGEADYRGASDVSGVRPYFLFR